MVQYPIERLRFPKRDSQTDEHNSYINSIAEHEHQFSDAVHLLC